MYMANKTLEKYDIHVFSSLNKQNIPGIIAIENYKEIDGMLYVLEETIEGNTLQEYLNEGISLKLKKYFMNEILKTIQILHHHSPIIILGNLDPASIWITSNDKVKISVGEQARADDSETIDIQCIGYLLKTMFPNHEYDALAMQCIQKEFTTIEEVISVFKHHRMIDGINIPGFRSKKLSHMIIAGIVYVLIIASCFSGDVIWNDMIITQPVFTTLYRLLHLTSCIAIIDICTHWTSLFDEFPCMSDTNPYKRMLGRCIAIIIILVITVLILMGLDKILL